MPTFRRNILSIFRDEVAMVGSGGTYLGKRKRRLREWVNQGQGIREKSSGPTRSLQAGIRGREGWVDGR
jgi:hypothetical protein